MLYIPEDDPDTPEDEEETALEIVDAIEWDGPVVESPVFEIDPDSLKSGQDGALSSQDVDNIYAWITGEKESILDEQDHPIYDYLSPGGINAINNYWNEMVSYENDMQSHGYNP